jgi:hypothetical protein
MSLIPRTGLGLGLTDEFFSPFFGFPDLTADLGRALQPLSSQGSAITNRGMPIDV